MELMASLCFGPRLLRKKQPSLILIVCSPPPITTTKPQPTPEIFFFQSGYGWQIYRRGYFRNNTPNKISTFFTKSNQIWGRHLWQSLAFKSQIYLLTYVLSTSGDQNIYIVYMKSMNSMCFMRLICRVVLCRPSKSNRQLRSRTDAQTKEKRSKRWSLGRAISKPDNVSKIWTKETRKQFRRRRKKTYGEI